MVGPDHGLDHLLRLFGDVVGPEKLEQAGADELGGSILPHNDVDDVVPVEPAGLAEENLLAVIVVAGTVFEVPGYAAVGPDGVLAGSDRHVFGVGQRPSGEGPRALLDVLLGVIADAHGEELQQLPPEVLIDGFFVVFVVVQPEQHGRVPGQLQQQVTQAAQAVVAEHVYLV